MGRSSDGLLVEVAGGKADVSGAGGWHFRRRFTGPNILCELLGALIFEKWMDEHIKHNNLLSTQQCKPPNLRLRKVSCNTCYF